jgi:hypothetical protein
MELKFELPRLELTPRDYCFALGLGATIVILIVSISKSIYARAQQELATTSAAAAVQVIYQRGMSEAELGTRLKYYTELNKTKHPR